MANNEAKHLINQTKWLSIAAIFGNPLIWIMAAVFGMALMGPCVALKESEQKEKTKQLELQLKIELAKQGVTNIIEK